jgi:two-component system, OmpR family, response regulator
MALDGDLAGGRVLVVEDDVEIADVLRRSLRNEGYEVKTSADGVEALDIAAGFIPDLVVLDLGLPRLDGIEVCRQLRSDGDVPILMLTARSETEDRVAGLDSGADDYLVKPFEFDELNARMRAVLRRHGGHAAPVLSYGGVTLDPATRQVTCGGTPVLLSAREFAVLEALMARPGALLSRAQLEDRLYGWGEEIESNAVSVYIHQLRRKLGADFIGTVRGVGYCVGRPGAGGSA